MRKILFTFCFFVLYAVVLAFVASFHLKRELFQASSPVPGAGKTVWLLWWQGWEEAPWLVKEVRDSWISMNPEWRIETVTMTNLPTFLPQEDMNLLENIPTLQAKSDFIRLSLLSRHGGVWADATMLCMWPLDEYIYEAMAPVGFWMYRGPAMEGDAPASWFIISMNNSYIIHRWKKAANEFWSRNTAVADYFWMDGLFYVLIAEDSTFKAQWAAVPYLHCEAPLQAHCLAGRTDGTDDDIIDGIRRNPPFAIKLSHHPFQERTYDSAKKDTNAYRAIQIVRKKSDRIYKINGREDGLSVVQTLEIRQDDSIAFRPEKHNSICVSPVCGDLDSVARFQTVCKANSIFLAVYDKCNFGKNVPPEVHCRPLKNVGRDLGTYLWFICRYYDRLPENLYFVPANDKHDRLSRFTQMISQEPQENCTTFDDGNFTISSYMETPLLPSPDRPIKNWFEKHVGPWSSWITGHKTACWNGVMKTSRKRILVRPKSLYERLYSQLVTHNSPEVVHYLERVMGAIF